MDILGKTKNIADLVKKYNDLELYEKIINLRDEIFGLKEENLDLKKEIKELRDTLQARKQMHYEAPYYWAFDGKKKDGPFCQKCYDSQSKPIRLQEISKGRWTCNACEKTVYDSSYVAPKPVFTSVRKSIRMVE